MFKLFNKKAKEKFYCFECKMYKRTEHKKKSTLNNTTYTAYTNECKLMKCNIDAAGICDMFEISLKAKKDRDNDNRIKSLKEKYNYKGWY